MNDRVYFRPLIPLLISLMGGILLGSRLAGFATGFGILAVVGGGFSLMCLYRRKSAFFMPVLLFAAVGCLSIQPWLSPRIQNNHIQKYADTGHWDILGQIDNQPWQIGNRTFKSLYLFKSPVIGPILSIRKVGHKTNRFFNHWMRY